MKDRSLWTLSMASSGIVLVLLAVHMGIMHLDSTLGIAVPAGVSPTDWASVAERMRSTLFTVTYVILLGAALYHGLYGLRNILFELSPGPTLHRVESATLVVLGLALFLVGSWAALASFGTSGGFGG